MEKKTILLVLICMLFLLGSFINGFFFYTDSSTVSIFGQVPLTIAVLGFFIFGTIFFGFIAFIPHILMGLTLGATQNAGIIIYFFPILIATYAGISFGNTILDDFQRKKYLTAQLKKTLLLLALALIIALAIEVFTPQIIELWPKNMTGLEIKGTKNTAEIADSLSKFIRTR